MKQIKIERILEDIEHNVNLGREALEDEDKGYPYVVQLYEATLKTVSFMLSQEIK